MTALELGRFLQRINDATTVPQLAAIEAELELDTDRAAASTLRDVIAARRKTFEARN